MLHVDRYHGNNVESVVGMFVIRAAGDICDIINTVEEEQLSCRL